MPKPKSIIYRRLVTRRHQVAVAFVAWCCPMLGAICLLSCVAFAFHGFAKTVDTLVHAVHALFFFRSRLTPDSRTTLIVDDSSKVFEPDPKFFCLVTEQQHNRLRWRSDSRHQRTQVDIYIFSLHELLAIARPPYSQVDLPVGTSPIFVYIPGRVFPVQRR